jgi:prophage regulatory protein
MKSTVFTRWRFMPLGGTTMSQALLRLGEVKARTGLSRSSIYLRIAEGTFPKQVSLGSRAVGWVDTEIQAWIDQAIRNSRSKQSEV